jgi:hypothetical protein
MAIWQDVVEVEPSGLFAALSVRCPVGTPALVSGLKFLYKFYI